ncbi:hypothetical protein D1872_228820 [compost metagenome]
MILGVNLTGRVLGIPVWILREGFGLVQSPDIQLPVLHKYILRAIGVVLQFRIAPTPSTGIVIEVIAQFIIPFPRIQPGSVKLILPNQRHALDRRIVRGSERNIAMIVFIGTGSVGISDKGVVDEIVADISARLPIYGIPDPELHIFLDGLEPQPVDMIGPIPPLIGAGQIIVTVRGIYESALTGIPQVDPLSVDTNLVYEVPKFIGDRGASINLGQRQTDGTAFICGESRSIKGSKDI